MIIRVKKKTHIIIVNFGYILIIFENNSLTLQIEQITRIICLTGQNNPINLLNL